MRGHGAWMQWGMTDGFLSRLDPTVRMLCILSFLSAALIVRPIHLAGGCFVAGLSIVAAVASGMSLRRFMQILAVGAVVFAPAFLLTPWLTGGAPLFEIPVLGWVTSRGLDIAATIVVRGQVALLLGSVLAASLDATDLALGLKRLPIPHIVVVMVLQVGRWVAVLLAETRGISQAIALRGAGRGLSGGWLVLANVPLVWVPRVTARARRVASAMEVRGYGGELPRASLARPGLVDASSVAVALLVLAGAIVIRMR
ncbi:MAG: hypothetical protein J7M25_01325 [Deltaproteobacteria bacterium]|nr:hypothetical protein [Deltaproteobacteria bacterium]